jgi:hypothetical protein
LTQANEKLVDGLWVKWTANPGEGLMEDMSMTPVFKWVKAQDLSDGYDFDIDIDVMNQTPQALIQSQQAFVSFLSIVQNFPAVALSPVLIREAAYRSGYRNEKVIQQYQQAAALMMAMKAQQQQMAQGQLGGGNPDNAATAQTAQMQTPTVDQTNTQIQNQLQ